MKGSIRKHGSMYYTRVKGVELKASKDLKEAQRILRERVNDYEDTGVIFKPKKITLSNALDLWFKECCEGCLRYGTIMDYKNVIKHLKESSLSNKYLAQITPDMLQEYVNEKVTLYAESTMKSQYAVLNPFFRWCVFPKKFIKDSPFQYVIKTKKNKNIDIMEEENESVTVLTLEEYNEVIQMLNDDYMALAFHIALHTGARLGEVCALTWNDINLKNSSITIKKNMFYNRITKKWEIGKTKNGKVRTVDIGDSLVKTLKDFKKKHFIDKMRYGEFYQQNYLELIEIEGQNHLQLVTTFSVQEKVQEIFFVCVRENGKPITPQGIKTKITRNIRKGGKGFDFHFHMLRHTHATMLIENKANMKDVQERLGHSKISITMDVYSHVTPKMKKETVDIFERAFNNE